MVGIFRSDLGVFVNLGCESSQCIDDSSAVCVSRAGGPGCVSYTQLEKIPIWLSCGLRCACVDTKLQCVHPHFGLWGFPTNLG